MRKGAEILALCMGARNLGAQLPKLLGADTGAFCWDVCHGAVGPLTGSCDIGVRDSTKLVLNPKRSRLELSSARLSSLSGGRENMLKTRSQSFSTYCAMQ